MKKKIALTVLMWTWVVVAAFWLFIFAVWAWVTIMINLAT